MTFARSSLWFAVAAGLVLGAMVHLAVVLRIPTVAENDAFGRLASFAAGNHAQVVPPSMNGEQTLALPDPAITTAVCAYDLAQGPIRVSAKSSGHFQSLSFHRRGGGVFYALTDRASVRGVLQIAVLTQRQLDDLLASEDEDEVVSEIRIVSPTAQGLVVVRTLAPFPSQKRREAQAAEQVTCGPAEAKASS